MFFFHTYVCVINFCEVLIVIFLNNEQINKVVKCTKLYLYEQKQIEMLKLIFTVDNIYGAMLYWTFPFVIVSP